MAAAEREGKTSFPSSDTQVLGVYIRGGGIHGVFEADVTSASPRCDSRGLTNTSLAGPWMAYTTFKQH